MHCCAVLSVKMFQVCLRSDDILHGAIKLQALCSTDFDLVK